MGADTKVTISGDASGLFKALADSSLAMKTTAREIEGAVGGIKSMFSNLAAPLLAITALVGGKEFLKGTIEETKNWTVEAQKLARVLGITTEQASVLNLAIGDIYGTQEEYLGAVAKLTKTLNTNEEAFKRLGVATRDHNGRLRDTPSIMADVNAKLMEMKAGTDRNLASAQIYGKSWMEVQRYLKLTPEVIQAAQEKAEKLNLIVGQDAVEATEAYRASMNDLEDTVKGLKLRIGSELMPVMTEFNTLMSDQGPVAISAMSGFIKGFNLICLDLSKVVVDLQSKWEATLKVLTDGVEFASKAMTAIANRDLKGLGYAWDAFKFKAEVTAAALKADLEANDLLINAQQSKFNGGGNGNAGPQAPPPGGKGATTKDKDEEKEFERLKARLEKTRYLYEKAGTDRGEYVEYKKSQEAAWWKEVLDTEGMTDKTRAKVQQEYYKAARAELKNHHDETKALDESYRDRYVAEQMALLNEEEAAATRSLALGKITEQQGLDWKRAIEQDKFNLELSALNDRLAVKGLEPIEISKLHGQIEALETSHRAKVRELTNQQADLDLQKDGWAGWAAGIKSALQQAQNHFETFKNAATQMLNGVENAFASGIQGMLSGQMSLGKGMKAIWQGIVSTVIQGAAQLIAKWIVMAAVKKALGLEEATTDGGRTAASLTAATAETWAAYAGIPFAGPILAEAQIALMYASMAASAGLAAGIGSGVAATGMAVGGRVDRPQLTVLGEAGPELVAPESTFLDWAANLEANIMARQAAVSSYGRQASGFASAAPQGGGQGTTSLTIQVMGHVLDTSQRGIRQFGEMVIDGARSAVRERSVVLKAAEVFGGL